MATSHTAFVCMALWVCRATAGWPTPDGPLGELYSMVYTNLDAAPCILLVGNDTQGFGCSSDGVVKAPLYPIKGPSQVKEFLSNPQHDQTRYTILVDEGAFVSALATSPRTAAAIIYIGEGNLWTSPAARRPNERWVPPSAAGRDWNPIGNGWEQKRFRIPIVAMEDRAAFDDIFEKASSNTLMGFSNPTWVAEMNYQMSAHNMSISQCLPQLSCMPVGGASMWATVQPLLGKADEPITVVLVPSTATALFHDLSVGSNTTVAQGAAAAAAFLELQSALATGKLKSKRNIVFFFGSAEEFAFTGSARFLTDVSSSPPCKRPGTKEMGIACVEPFFQSIEFRKLSLDRVDQIIALDQTAPWQGAYYRQSKPSSLADSFVSSAPDGFLKEASGNVYPPHPIYKWMEVAKSTASHIMLTGYDESFTTKQYMSERDNSRTVDLVALTKFANMLAKALAKILDGTGNEVEVNDSTVGQLFRCGADPHDGCDDTISSRELYSKYPSVFNFKVQGNGWVTYLRRRLLLALGKPSGSCGAATDCEIGGECIQKQCYYGSAWYHRSYSPGIDFDYGQGSFNVTNATFPMWAESNWGADIGVRVYQTETVMNEALWLACSVVSTSLFGFGAFVLLRKLDKHARDNPPE